MGNVLKEMQRKVYFVFNLPIVFCRIRDSNLLDMLHYSP